MASFAELIGRLEGEQRLQKNLNFASLGMDVEEERQELEEGRSDYFDQVEKAEIEMAKRARKRAKRGLFGTLLGAVASFTPLGAVGGAIVGGLASKAGRDSVKPYGANITMNIDTSDNKFNQGAIRDFTKDIASSNAFIREAQKGQSLLNLTSAFQDAYNVYSFQDTFGDDIRQFVGNTRIGQRIGNRRLERQLGRAKRDRDSILGGDV